MKMFDKIKKNDIEYICLNTLYIEDKIIHEIYEKNTSNSIYIEEKDGEYIEIIDEKVLQKIKEFTTPKTDIVIELQKKENRK